MYRQILHVKVTSLISNGAGSTVFEHHTPRSGDNAQKHPALHNRQPTLTNVIKTMQGKDYNVWDMVEMTPQ